MGEITEANKITHTYGLISPNTLVIQQIDLTTAEVKETKVVVEDHEVMSLFCSILQFPLEEFEEGHYNPSTTIDDIVADTLKEAEKMAAVSAELFYPE